MFTYTWNFFLIIGLFNDGLAYGQRQSYRNAEKYYLNMPYKRDITSKYYSSDTLVPITEQHINERLHNRAPSKPIFKPTSILRPGYGVLFDHIGRIFHAVQTHYLSLGVFIPSHPDIPEAPYDRFLCSYARSYEAQEGLDLWLETCNYFNALSRHYADRIQYLRQQLYHKFHTELPALLPNQAIPYNEPSDDLHTFTDVKHGSHNRYSRSVKTGKQILKLPFVDQIRLKTYFSHYGTPLYDDSVTLFGPVHNHTSKTRSKRIAVSTIIRGANIFGTLISKNMPLIKKIGGWFMRGIKGLFHKKRHSALLQATTIFRKFAKTKLMKINTLLASKSFKNLHLSRLSFFKMMHLPFVEVGFNNSITDWLKNAATKKYFHDGGWYHPLKLTIAASARMTLIQEKVVQDLLHLSAKVDNFINGLTTLATGKLAPSLVHPDTLLNLLRDVVKDVTAKNPSLTPLHPELYAYYDSPGVTFTNTHNMIVLQIPIHFVNSKQPTLDLFRIQTTPVPLDVDTYQGIEHKYTSVFIDAPYLAVSSAEYAPLTTSQLETCEQENENYICEALRFTASMATKICSVAIFLDDPPSLVKDLCTFTYHNFLEPQPTLLQTQDEILLAHFPPGWTLLCDDQMERPVPHKDAIYVVINKYDLCQCGILAQGYYLYEVMRSCDNPDTVVTLYYTQNMALLAYDSKLVDSKPARLSKSLPQYRAPDIAFTKVPDPITIHAWQTSSPSQADQTSQSPAPSHSSRKKRSPPKDDDEDDELFQDTVDISMPLQEAVSFMDNGQVYSVDTPSQYYYHIEPQTIEAPPEDNILASNDMYFHLVTLVNAVLNVIYACILAVTYRNRFGFLTTLLATLKEAPPVNTLRLLPTLYPANFSLPPEKTVSQDTTETYPLSCHPVLYVMLSIPPFLFVLWISKTFIFPYFHQSSTIRLLCPMSCVRDASHLTPSTDILLDIVHISTGQSIRCYVTTLSAPPASLSFSGNVRLKGFYLKKGKPFIKLFIDWHSCLLHFDDTVIPLPPYGTALTCQPNLLTDFKQPDPYHVLLLARHMDSLIPIPHINNLDYVTAVDHTRFPVYLPEPQESNPYKYVHDVIHSMMPMAPSPDASAASPLPELV